MTVFLIFVAFALGLLLGNWRGFERRPEVQEWQRHRTAFQRMIAERDQRITQYNAEADDRETRAYERGRLDQAEVESHQRSASAKKGHATKRERRQGTMRPVDILVSGMEAMERQRAGSADGPETP